MCPSRCPECSADTPPPFTVSEKKHYRYHEVAQIARLEDGYKPCAREPRGSHGDMPRLAPQLRAGGRLLGAPGPAPGCGPPRGALRTPPGTHRRGVSVPDPPQGHRARSRPVSLFGGFSARLHFLSPCSALMWPRPRLPTTRQHKPWWKPGSQTHRGLRGLESR